MILHGMAFVKYISTIKQIIDIMRKEKVKSLRRGRMKTGKALLDEIREYKGGYGECAFWWLGQLGYILKANNTIVAIDPYLNPQGSRLIPPPLAPEDLAIADYVLGTHNHGDHIDHYTYSLLAKASEDVKFVIPELSVEAVSQKLNIPRERFIGMTERTIITDNKKDLTITGIASAHEFLDRDEATGYYPYLGYIVEVNGVSFYHSGDTCRYDGLESKLKEYDRFNIMFVPINGRSGKKYRSGTIGNMNFAEAVDLCGMLNPILAVPGHYEMFDNNSADPMEFIDFMEAKYPLQQVWIGGHGVKVEHKNI